MMAQPQEINSRICPTTACINQRYFTVKQNYFDSKMIKKRKFTLMQRSSMDSFSADVNVYM